MVKKSYFCSECGYQYPSELTELIDKKVQVFCEKCGTAFSMEGVEFKKDYFQYIKKRKPIYRLSEKQESNLNKVIQKFNELSVFFLFFASILAFILIIPNIIIYPEIWGLTIIRQILLGGSVLFIAIYDLKYISPRVKEKRYDEIMLDSFCWGILGSILFGAGAVLLIKGLLIIIYVLSNPPEGMDRRPYDVGLLMKDSFNNFSGIAGFAIILIALWELAIGIYTPGGALGVRSEANLNVLITILIVFFFISLLSIIADLVLKKKIKNKQNFDVRDFGIVLTLGILGVFFGAAGIFILLKAIIIFALLFGVYHAPEPIKEDRSVPREQTVIVTPSAPILMRDPRLEEEKEELTLKISEVPKKEEEAPFELVKSKKKIKEIKLKLHDSLLPIKDEKDKKVVKEYFSRIFTILSKDLREKIKDLKISKKEKNELLKELAFLSAEQQAKYIESIISLYKTRIPEILIKRIRRIPNVKPEHYSKIIDQLRYMDSDEQIRFIEFLEQHA
ncbi:MAG: hypothetical protein ACTSR8_15255 [Promethearchaeota archaeon]